MVRPLDQQVRAGPHKHLPSLPEEVGIDLGVKSFAVLSTGEIIENPRYYRHAEEQIQAAHQKIHRRKKGSHRRARTNAALERLYRKVLNRRRDFWWTV